MKLHDTWSFECFHFPAIPWYVKYQGLKHYWNSMGHEITDVEIVAKLPDTRKLQHVYCTKFDDTFNFHAWYWKKWYRLFTRVFTESAISLVSIALHCISGTYLWGCSIILKMIFNSSDHSTIFITAPVLFTLTNCPTHEGKTQVLNRVTSFILKFKYRNKV